MKQIFQSLENGETLIFDIPSPKIKKGHLLIKSSYSLISSGTEKMLINFGKSNIVNKLKKQQDRIPDLLEKLKSEGGLSTYKAIKNKLQIPIPLGYSNVGEVIGIGEEVKGFNIGDKVVSNGPHAEIILVPKNLCAKIPEGVSKKEAVFTIPGSIGLQGIRLLKPTFGETFLIIGLGLIGNLTAQLLKSQGCRVIGIDTDPLKCDLSEELGIEIVPKEFIDKPLNWLLKTTNNNGVDGVIITASTKSDKPIIIATKACRKRGRIILVGVTGLNLKRDLMYEKEISFQVSCSYGPGRYDENYEENGFDYPIGFVRWTEKRNFEAVLFALQSKILNVQKLITKSFDIKDSLKAYSALLNDPQNIGIVLNYPTTSYENQKTLPLLKTSNFDNKTTSIKVGVIGAGNYSSRYIIPTLSKSKIGLETIVASSGLRPYFFGKKYKFKSASTSQDSVLKNPSINTIFIATRHDSHAELVMKAIKNGKNIFVEKPLCINKQELEKIKEIYKESYSENLRKRITTPTLMIGFNRRFSPYIKLIKDELDKYKEPKSFIYTVNAGFIKREHWVHDIKIGGGRLIGEACHFVDLLRYLCGSNIEELRILKSFKNKLGDDTFSINLSFIDGSIGTINYFANGNKSYPKEKLEIFFSGKIILLDNFRNIKSWGLNKRINKSSFFQKKGQKECIFNFLESIKKGKPSPIPIDQILEVHSFLLN